MIKKQVTRSGSIMWNKALNVLMAVALLLPLIVMAPAPAAFKKVRREFSFSFSDIVSPQPGKAGI